MVDEVKIMKPVISYPVKLDSTGMWWHIGLKDTSIQVVVRTEPANWIARLLRKLVKVRISVNVTETGSIAQVQIFDRVLDYNEMYRMHQREREHFV